MDRRQPARASKKRLLEEAYSNGSENDGSDASWEDDSTSWEAFYSYLNEYQKQTYQSAIN
ncbi:hypothetical protein PInf_018197 [Phytophthora infestans]|nr:hypothetical protein PInf_018197 [Phytophthora infestans]